MKDMKKHSDYFIMNMCDGLNRLKLYIYQI